MMMQMIMSLFFAAARATTISLVTFDGATGTTFNFVELNDPVMGGQSVGTWSTDDGFGIMNGTVKDVPSLSAPGFIKAFADGTFADASSASGGSLVLSVRSTTPEFEGFRISVASGTTSPSYACSGGGSIPYSRGCYKAGFSVPAGDDFADVLVPFANFSDLWSPYTGDATTTCAEDGSACLNATKLAAIIRLEFWAEGYDGSVHLEVESVSATSATVGDSPPAAYDTCQGPVQSELLYGISGRTTPAGVPVAVDDDETLADAVCCDIRVQDYAEPQYLYEAPDIDLFGKINTTTTFYDSVCGLPLFTAPVNRTMADFEADTLEHGWPSFRIEEVNFDNVITNETTGFVTSTCGTHLGSFLPDDQGDRWCIDLSCIAGTPAFGLTASPPAATAPL